MVEQLAVNTKRSFPPKGGLKNFGITVKAKSLFTRGMRTPWEPATIFEEIWAGRRRD
jgi:hypothetical protein